MSIQIVCGKYVFIFVINEDFERMLLDEFEDENEEIC